MSINFIDMIKNRPSCTELDNACDAIVTLATIISGSTILILYTILFHMCKAFGSAKQFYNTIDMSASQISKLEEATMRFVYMSKMKYVTARIGAEQAGYCLPAGYIIKRLIAGFENSAVDRHKIFSNICYPN